MENILKVYAPYSPSIEGLKNLLERSASGIPGMKLIPTLFGSDAPKADLGATHQKSYMDLMLLRWKLLPNLIKENLGNNIVSIDIDCVFNKNNPYFSEKINKELDTYDFTFQHDLNSYMCNGINMGIFAVKCTQKTLDFVTDWVKEMAIIPKVTGYPQIEWNEWFNKEEYDVTFSILDDKYGANTGSDCVIYHAIGVSDKIGKLKEALLSWRQ